MSWYPYLTIHDLELTTRIQYYDYVQLNEQGAATVYLNNYTDHTPKMDFRETPELNAAGIGQRPQEISFHDVNGYVERFTYLYIHLFY